MYRFPTLTEIYINVMHISIALTLQIPFKNINIMKKAIIFIALAITFSSCADKMKGVDTPDVKEVEKFLTVKTLDIPVKQGYVTTVTANGDTIASVNTAMAIMAPKTNDIRITYTPQDEYPNTFTENTTNLYQVVCFEDSKSGDYDYNDLVIHVRYQTKGEIFGLGVHPIALGSTKPIKLGCAVYKGSTLVFKGLITPDGKNCREQYFENQSGFINTVGNTINQNNGGWNQYLASTIRNWDMSKIPGEGPMRVEWYIRVDGNTELYALSTAYINQSLDTNGLPCGLVITNSGVKYTQPNGVVAGNDWFAYPQESKHIKDVYPEIWKWLTEGASYSSFSDFYNGTIPSGAYPATTLWLYVSSPQDLSGEKYRQN